MEEVFAEDDDDDGEYAEDGEVYVFDEEEEEIVVDELVQVDDYAVNEDGSPNTAHSLNLVQFIVIGAGDEVKSVKDGALCNVAPTILKLMGIPQPEAMTAEPLI